MKTTKALLIGGLAVAIGCMAARVLIVKPQAAPELTRPDVERVAAPEQTRNPSPAAVLPAPNPDPAPAEQADNISGGAQPLQTAKAEAAQKVAPQSTPAKKPKEPLHDPDARIALRFVGADPDAEAYWLEAIYDSSLPDQEREDLIEDLNEDGLSDQKRPGPEDLPLIMNRIALIEKIVPAADEFMLPHLREAYKDLLNLAEITQGGGKPVQ